MDGWGGPSPEGGPAGGEILGIVVASPPKGVLRDASPVETDDGLPVGGIRIHSDLDPHAGGGVGHFGDELLIRGQRARP